MANQVGPRSYVKRSLSPEEREKEKAIRNGFSGIPAPKDGGEQPAAHAKTYRQVAGYSAEENEGLAKLYESVGARQTHMGGYGARNLKKTE